MHLKKSYIVHLKIKMIASQNNYSNTENYRNIAYCKISLYTFYSIIDTPLLSADVYVPMGQTKYSASFSFLPFLNYLNFPIRMSLKTDFLFSIFPNEYKIYAISLFSLHKNLK